MWIGLEMLQTCNVNFNKWCLNITDITCIWLINPLECFFGIESDIALDRNPGPRYNTLLLRLIPRDLYSSCPLRQFHILPSLLDSRPTLMHACQAGRQFVPFLWWSLVWPSLGANTNAWEVGTITNITDKIVPLSSMLKYWYFCRNSASKIWMHMNLDEKMCNHFSIILC